MELNFYTRPFRLTEYGGWVYDAKSNFVFQFEKPFTRDKEAMQNIIFRLNALDKETEKIPDYNLTLKNPIEIYSNESPFIMIRGWGGLTGIGGHNFDSEKASKIQDDFAQYLLYILQPTH
jgi:hypothetical protein